LNKINLPEKAAGFSTVFLDQTEREIVRMHNRISGGHLQLDELALQDVAHTAECIARTAQQLGWLELERCAADIRLLARRPIATIVPALVRAQLGQIFFTMDRQLAARRRGEGSAITSTATQASSAVGRRDPVTPRGRLA
jgi:hypothetical protein